MQHPHIMGATRGTNLLHDSEHDLTVSCVRSPRSEARLGLIRVQRVSFMLSDASCNVAAGLIGAAVVVAPRGA
eukprot:15027087-Alexandrium_andersonii.AAC.1